MNIITGEKLQQICNIYLGIPYDFQYNPVILNQKNKQLNIETINNTYDNPKIIFCYTYRIKELSRIIHFFKNNFILISHNSDEDVTNSEYVHNILKCDKLQKWFTQNLCINHPKIELLPIGFANSQWNHGKIDLFLKQGIFNKSNINNKYNDIFFNFSIGTNSNKRQPCYNKLINKLKWLPNIEPLNNLQRLSTYKFCICPEGNGVDTHRLWECLYLKVVPIVINSEFTQTLLLYNIPLVVLNNWSDLDINLLNYDDYKEKFNNETLIQLLDFEYIKNKIYSIII
jgi:hypothetical protein